MIQILVLSNALFGRHGEHSMNRCEASPSVSIVRVESDCLIETQPIDELMKEYRKPEDVIGENGLLKQLKGDFGTSHERGVNGAPGL